MARTAEGPHPLTGKVFTLSDQGLANVRLRLRLDCLSRLFPVFFPALGLLVRLMMMACSRSLRILLRLLSRMALWTLEACTEAARVCRINGYQVPWHALPLIMKLSEVAIEASAAERRKLRAEVKAIYADIKPVAADAE